jgi:ubiquinone/menaquinone biosynthesis C-methylase UbiE
MAPIDRWIHASAHAGRSAWFLGHALAAQRLASPTLESLPEDLPDRGAYLADLMALLRRDQAQIEAGHYAMPEVVLPSPRDALRASARFFDDLGRINLRRMRRDGQEVYRQTTGTGDRLGRPRYYLQNFHYQTDGWLSDHSAELYDLQVDVLFNGATDAMRRQALLPLGDFLKGKRLADLRLLDVATGTGRFLATIKQNYPRVPLIGLDLSDAYLAKARRDLARWSWLDLVLANAEALPFPAQSVDVATSVYLLHELPRGARGRVASEMARVLKPGGRLILVDSLQTGDHPPFDALLELFPTLYHEPYYRDYIGADLKRLFQSQGLSALESDRAFLSKILTFAKSG